MSSLHRLYTSNNTVIVVFLGGEKEDEVSPRVVPQVLRTPRTLCYAAHRQIFSILSACQSSTVPPKKRRKWFNDWWRASVLSDLWSYCSNRTIEWIWCESTVPHQVQGSYAYTGSREDISVSILIKLCSKDISEFEVRPLTWKHDEVHVSKALSTTSTCSKNSIQKDQYRTYIVGNVPYQKVLGTVQLVLKSR
jgi:hypothetical protein